MTHRLFRTTVLVLCLTCAFGCSRRAIDAMAPASAADQTTLNLIIEVDADSRQFLIDTGQTVLITASDPSQNDTLLVVQSFSPLGDQSQVGIGTLPTLFMSVGATVPFSTVTMQLTSPVSYGQAYLFNGVSIVNAGPGIPGTVGIEYVPIRSGNAEVSTGLALPISNSSVDDTASNAAFESFDLQLYENRLLPSPSAVVYVLIGQGINTGMALPASLLKPAPGSAPVAVAPASASAAAQAGPSQSPGAAPLVPPIQLGRYLSVDLLSNAQTTVHFDRTINAFVYGADPD
ncbi:hypothetical protein JL100_008460 [Skermanella mucosa]|uniref:hypothetical protein n=1 Tax=Skermanella mucosa TaxID=1789672 RepID=UPI00192CDD55|nr:hypothetical protein [Skermanella mucosa]UEM22763.1 hypothetical protein JL100_008460 [Skermanella mucosa]